MKKTLLVLAAIGSLCLLLIVRMFYKQSNHQADEREWFVQALEYEFSARVDSIRMLNKHTGTLWCSITEGEPKSHREDSLKKHFKDHDMMYLIFKHSGDSIRFVVQYGDRVAKGDSVRVSSSEDAVTFFRNGRAVASEKLTNTITAYGRPFFLKKD